MLSAYRSPRCDATVKMELDSLAPDDIAVILDNMLNTREVRNPSAFVYKAVKNRKQQYSTAMAAEAEPTYALESQAPQQQVIVQRVVQVVQVQAQPQPQPQQAQPQQAQGAPLMVGGVDMMANWRGILDAPTCAILEEAGMEIAGRVLQDITQKVDSGHEIKNPSAYAYQAVTNAMGRDLRRI